MTSHNDYMKHQNDALAELDEIVSRLEKGEIDKEVANREILRTTSTLKSHHKQAAEQPRIGAIRFYVGCLVTFGLALFAGYLCVHGFLTDQAPTIGRYSRHFWFSRQAQPSMFWVSIIFHAALGALLFLCGLAAVCGRHLQRHKA